MRIRSGVGLLILGFFIIAGCAKRIPVIYDHVERTNRVEVTLVSGKRIEGTVSKIEPHQLTLLLKGWKLGVVPKSSLRSIKRKPPVYDDFGRGISEEEIHSVEKNRNTLIYGIGGGALSFGVSFFVGSLVSESMEENGGTVLASTTAAGGVLGTVLFRHAGKAKDRRVAIENIREKRRSVELKKKEETKTPDELQKQLEEEKKKQEKLRKERERILRQLGKKKEE